MRSLIIVLKAKYYLGDQIKKNDVAHVGERRGVHKVLVEKAEG